MKRPCNTNSNHFFMKKALKQARRAFENNEIPIGSVIINAHKEIIASGYNRVESLYTQSAHAEIEVIKKAGKKRNNWRFEDCWLYTTLEPCSMCMHLIVLSRFKGVVFGAKSPQFGYQLDTLTYLQVYKKSIVQIVGGVCASEAKELLQQFFRGRRKKE